jgi:cytochrome c-type biogenesis protein CcmE
MKKSSLIAIIVIAVAIGIIISTAGDASSYVNFDTAYEMSQAGNKTKIHVVGQLKKDALGNVIGVNPRPDKLSFTFVLVDENNREQTVFYNEPVPPDFYRSEQVVVVGAFREDLFVADKILMKCPSKYQEEEVKASASTY